MRYRVSTLILVLFLCLLLEPSLISYGVYTKVIDGYPDKLISYKFEGLPTDFRDEITALDDRQITEKLLIKPVQNVLFQSELLSDLMDSAWPMQSHDNKHTGRSPYSTQNNLGSEKWRFLPEDPKTGGPITGGIAIAEDGTLYFGTLYFYFYAINSDGTFEWKYHVGNRIASTPAIAEDGTIYIGCWDSKLYAFSPGGSLKWKFPVGNDIDGAPAIAKDGTIYITTLGSGLYAVNPNGTMKWHYNHGYSFSDPAIGNDGTIYYGDFDNAIIYAINPDGTEKWNVTGRINIRGSASIADDGTVYMEAGGELYALNPDNGSVIWKTPVGLTAHCPAIDKNGIIYVGEGSGQMDQFYAIYPNGTIKWSFDPGNNSGFWGSSAAVSDDGTIYIGTCYYYPYGKGGEIIALNSDDGSVHWRKLITSLGWVGSSPCIGTDGTVYVCSRQTRDIDEEFVDTYGYVHAFGPVNSNEPPNTPVITGKSKGSIRYNYYCYISTVDPDLNPVSFCIDWGDNNTELTEQYASTEKAFLGHRYADTGTYTIRVKAIDEFDAESDWATLTVSMSKNKTMSLNLFLQKLIQHFPFFEKILNQITL